MGRLSVVLTRRRALLRLAAGAVTLGCVGALVPASSASADPSLTELRRQAVALRAELDRLGVQQDLAVERYDAAREALRQATTDEVLSTTGLSDVRRAAAATRARSSERVRAIYTSGGSLGLAASVLDSSTIGDALTRWKAVEAVVGTERTVQQAADRQVLQQRRTALSSARLRARTVAGQAAAAQAVDDVRAALTRQQAVLARTDARVVALAEQQRAEAEARATARAAQEAALLGLGSGPSGAPSGVPSSVAAPPTTVRPADGRGLEGASAADQSLPDVPAPSAAAGAAIAAARTRLGLPYVWGATGPTSFDCSGLTQWAYRQAGVSIPRTSRQQYAGLPKVPLASVAPGDLVFYATDVQDPSTIHHVGIYLGEGLSLYAPRTGSNVKIGPVGYGRIIGAVRPSAARP
jgi:cell wall-associated NlpC family hydrolase